jgi:ribosome-binding factor A
VAVATSQRQDRVAHQIQRELSDLFLGGIKDDRVAQHLVSVTGVKVTKDLSVARVYVSVLGGESDRAEAMRGLESAAGFIRREIGQRINLRHVPEMRFILDRSIERGVNLISLLDKIKEESDE